MTAKSDWSRNSLLVGLPPTAVKRLQPHFQFIAYQLGQVLYNSGQTIDFAYFPDDAVISLLVAMEGGRSVEVTLIGNDGVLGVRAALGETTAVNEAVVQIPGSCWRIKAGILASEFQRGGVLHERLLSYTLALLTQISQTAACNRVHLLEQRMARWLLMVNDRIERLDFPITHEFLSHMLGTPRSEVTLAAGALRKAGIIHYARGTIRILDSQLLQTVACECYRADQASRQPRGTPPTTPSALRSAKP